MRKKYEKSNEAKDSYDSNSTVSFSIMTTCQKLNSTNKLVGNVILLSCLLSNEFVNVIKPM